MRLPETITYILYKMFGIINCYRCGHLIVNPTDDKIMKHVEYCSERELDQDEADY